MEAIYLFWCKVFGIIGGTIALVVLFVQIAYLCYRWINDEDFKIFPQIEKLMIKIGNDGYYDHGEFWMFWFGIVCVAVGFAFTWPIVIPGLLTYGCLYSIRHFKRFQKKIKKALGDKADKKHKHNQDDIILND